MENKEIEFDYGRRTGLLFMSAVCIFNTIAIAWIVYRLWPV